MIRLDDITRVYGEGDTKVPAVRGVTASLDRGRFYAIVGPSGSGKSTLLNLMGALDRPSSGRIAIEGKEIGNLDDGQRTRLRRTLIGFVFQSFHLLPTLSAVENVSICAELAGRSSRKSRGRAEELLSEVGLTRRRHHRPSELSNGEMQRVAIARALMMDPPLVLADEPTGNLDSQTSEEIMDLLRYTVGDERTLVLVTHDPAIARQAHHVIRMQDGQVVEEEP